LGEFWRLWETAIESRYRENEAGGKVRDSQRRREGGRGGAKC
jgi:hypothetical protein